MEEKKTLTINDLTPDNFTEFLFSIFQGKTNTDLIMLAGFNSGVYGYNDLMNYLNDGIIPNYHTFATWKKNGFIVKKGQKAAFKADIWKYTEKKGTMSQEDADKLNAIMCGPNGEPLHKAGDETTSSRYIKKLSFFFGPDQVEKLA